MSYLLQPYTILLFLATGLSAAMAISALKMKSNLGTRSVAILMGAVAFWAMVSIFEVISPDPQTKIFSHGFKYLFIVIVPVAWLSFGLYYANRLRHWRIVHLLLLSIIPLMTLLFVATNSIHPLMFTSLEWHHYNKGVLLFRHFGPWFWVHTTYSYILLLIGFFYLAKSLLNSPGPYRRQLISLLIGGLTPWICNSLFIFKKSPFPYLDLTPFAFSISGLAFLWGIMRYQLLDLVPIAKEIVIHNLHDGIIVIDEARRILDINPTAARMVMKSPDELIGQSPDQVITWWSSLSDLQTGGDHNFQMIKINLDDGVRWVRVSKTPLHNNGRMAGQLVVIVNITDIHNAEEALRLSEDKFKSITENAPILIFSLDTSEKFTYTNPAWQKILGYSQEVPHRAAV